MTIGKQMRILVLGNMKSFFEKRTNCQIVINKNNILPIVYLEWI